MRVTSDSNETDNLMALQIQMFVSYIVRLSTGILRTHNMTGSDGRALHQHRRGVRIPFKSKFFFTLFSLTARVFLLFNLSPRVQI